jgi:4-amino-4-deoxy-L-arabinose transferase-like glycosyltransferase
MVRLATPVDASPYSSGGRARTAAGVLGLAAVVALAFCLDLGRPDFWDPGESRYAETVREMMVTGDWLEPTLGFQHYYDKPPGFFWMVGGAFKAFGQHEWAARVPSVASALLTIALVVGFAWRRLGVRPALGAGVILATAAQFVALGRAVRMDMVLTLLTTATLLQAFALWERRDEPPGAETSPHTWPLYLVPALGLLVKGPVALLLPVLIVAAFLAATRTAIRLRHLRPGLGAVLALLMVSAWYGVQAVRSPDYLWTFLWQHNFGRFVGRSLAGHAEPIWFFVWILPLTFLPWTLFLPAALHEAQQRARRGEHLTTFLLVWCVVPFVFFSVSRAKLATYLLPIFPALALLTAAHLDRALRSAEAAAAFRIPALIWTAGMLLLALGAPIAIAFAYPGYASHALPALLLAIFPVLGWQLRRSERSRWLPALVATAALATQALFYRVGAPIVNEFSSMREAAEIAHDLPSDAMVFAYKTRGHSFTYYGGRLLTRVRSPEAAAEALARRAPTAVLVKERHLEKIRQHLSAPACIWWQGPSGRVLLANVPRRNVPGGPRLTPTSVPVRPLDESGGGGVPRC